MKKLLIAIALVACMLLSFVACDTEEPLVNDPELNVASVVSTINSDKTLAELVSNSSAQLPENELSDIMAKIKQLNFESTIKADVDGENSEMYFAMKDGVLFVEADGEGGYVFIEDDLKLVMVSEHDGKYYGEVSGTLTELLPFLGSGESTDFGDMTSVAVSKAMDKLADMKLPEISAEDITVDGDKYILSEEYILNIIDKVLDTFYAEFEGDKAMSTQVEAMKAAIREYVLAMNIELYFYVQYEEIVGIGAAISPEKDVAEELFDCDAISLSFDMNMGDVAVKADIVSEGENYNFDFVVDTVVDAEGSLNAVNMKLDAKLPATDYVYVDAFESIDLKGTLELGIELKADLSDKDADGEIFTLDVDYSKGNYKAYEFDPKTFENVYSPELTELYGKDSEKGELSVKCVTTDGGEKVKLTAVGSGETIEEGEKDTTNYSVTVDCSKTVSNFPTVPAAAEEARQEALDEYDDFDFDFDYDFDEEFDFDTAFGDN